MSTGHLEYGSQNMSLNASFDISQDLWQYNDIWASVLQEFRTSQVTLTEPSTLALLTLYVIIFCMSMAGNILVLLVIVPNRRLSTVTNNFLVNLAVADLLGRIIIVALISCRCEMCLAVADLLGRIIIVALISCRCEMCLAVAELLGRISMSVV